ncbi:MAG: queuosine precursor transporter [Salibacteraceae bacterium]
MNRKQRKEADQLYLFLAGLFIAALVTTNLIASKFISLDVGFYTFRISAGTLPYPLTFLMTDLLSEFYGRKRTNQVVMVGFFASIFVLLTLLAADYFPALAESPVSDDVFHTTFGQSGKVIFSSMTAYLLAQLVDVRLFHFWKGLTKGKMLWVRNNGSTILSQLVDSTLVVLVLFLGSESWDFMLGLIGHLWLFKTLWALIDTPIIYALVWIVRRRFKLAPGQEFNY